MFFHDLQAFQFEHQYAATRCHYKRYEQYCDYFSDVG